eukprot:jgi/Tetstr1/441712/TSEL_029935.t1
MISALAWVPKGAAKAVPDVVDPSEEELERLREMAELEADEEEGGSDGEGNGGSSDSDMDADGADDKEAAIARARAVASALKSGRSAPSEDTPAAAGNTAQLESALAELDMDNYDEEDEGDLPGLLGGALPRGKDPYLKLGSDDDSEIEDFNIRDSDLLILAARNDEDVSTLEVWLYEEAREPGGEANLYVHHEVMLAYFPLSLAWLDCDPGGRPDSRNFVAVGTFSPEIELWDLDRIDAVEPVASLGGILPPDAGAGDGDEGASKGLSREEKKKLKKKKKKAKVALVPGSHEDAVLGLSWNSEYRNVLASASADHTVKVWDVTRQECKHTLRHHKDKVQAVAWNPAEAPVMLTGGFDRLAALADVRAVGSCASWAVSRDVEALTWCPHAPTCFLVSSEDGLVACYDARKGAGSDPLYSLHAHDKPTCTMSFSVGAPGLLLTGSTDKKLKLWDVADNKPSLLATQEPKVGAIFSAGFSKDSPFLVAAAGAKGTVAVWDTMASPAVAAKYGSRG